MSVNSFLYFLYNCSWVLLVLVNGSFLFLLCGPFVSAKPKLLWKALLLLTFGGASGMVIWVGDNNLLFTLPVFLGLFGLCTQGDQTGRLAVGVIFFCLVMSICALLDTYLFLLQNYDVSTRLARPVIFGLLWLVLRRRLPCETVKLSHRLWKLVLALAAMPLCALIAVVLLTYQKYHSQEVYSLAMNQGLVVLPFVFLTSLALLLAISVLADHERLERAEQLADQRAVYYQELQRQQLQVRTLRHDLRNHLTVLQGLLEMGDTERAGDYLAQLAGSPALQGGPRLCENETANAVLAAKGEELRRAGLTCRPEISLPEHISIGDADLCALLGNAMDNAIEGARAAADREILFRCRAEKGLFMLRVENAMGGPVNPDLSTTKADRTAHGLGLAGMREIAGRYDGSLEAGPEGDRFSLVVCIPLQSSSQP